MSRRRAISSTVILARGFMVGAPRLPSGGYSGTRLALDLSSIEVSGGRMAVSFRHPQRSPPGGRRAVWWVSGYYIRGKAGKCLTGPVEASQSTRTPVHEQLPR